jgi:hypothetical protein
MQLSKLHRPCKELRQHKQQRLLQHKVAWRRVSPSRAQQPHKTGTQQLQWQQQRLQQRQQRQ